MKNQIKIEFKEATIEALELYSQLLNKDMNTILQEALDQYFKDQQDMLQQKHYDDEDAKTNLNFDEFWDGVDI
jgi:hypothetical protein